MVEETKQKMIKLKEVTGASFIWCKQAIDAANGDFEKAKLSLEQRIKAEGRSFSINRSGKPSKSGKVVADVNADGTIGIIIGLSCISDGAANSEIFVELLDNLTIVAFNEKPTTEGQLLGSPISSLKLTFKDKTIKSCNDVEQLIEQVSLKLKEPIIVEYVSLMEVNPKSDEYMSIYCYNHIDNKKAGLCSFLIPDKVSTKDLEWLKRSITATITCYNPLVIHEYTLPQSVIDEVLEREKIELTINSPVQDKDDMIALDKMLKWKLNSFLDNVVLDRIKIPAQGKQENAPIVEGEQIPLKAIKIVCEEQGIVPVDMDCFQIKVNTI